MNYLAHGRELLDWPLPLAGTAVPDLLRVAHRRARIPAEQAARARKELSPEAAELCRGILRHHDEDRWFHQQEAFVTLSQKVTLHLRSRFPARPGFRPSVLGHVLVEVLLDATLADRDESLLERYYQSLERLDAVRLEGLVEQIRGQPAPGLATVFTRFRATQFLRDYRTDAGVTRRLAGLVRQLRLPELPEGFAAEVGVVREWVRDDAAVLLPGAGGEGLALDRSGS